MAWHGMALQTFVNNTAFCEDATDKSTTDDMTWRGKTLSTTLPSAFRRDAKGRAQQMAWHGMAKRCKRHCLVDVISQDNMRQHQKTPCVLAHEKIYVL